MILMVGSELTAEEGEIEPKEMVEFLTECRLHALSRENYPEEDRVGKFITTFSFSLFVSNGFAKLYFNCQLFHHSISLPFC